MAHLNISTYHNIMHNARNGSHNSKSNNTWTRNIVSFGLALGPGVSKTSAVTGIGGWGGGREICRHFWKRAWSSRINSVNSHMEVLGAKCRTVDTFGLALCFRVSQMSTVTRGGVVVANCGAVVTVGGVWGLGVDAKSVRNVRKRSPCFRKRPRPKIVAKRKTIVTFGLALGLRV